MTDTVSISQPDALHGGNVSIGLDCFRQIADIAADEAGLSIPESKIALVQSRVSKRMRVIGIADFDAYLALVLDRQNRNERRELVSALTTNVSSFFRERHHFDYLADTVLPRLKSKLAAGHPVRLWSAGCSSGQEPYSIAMECLRFDPAMASKDVLILATDIDSKILKQAADGIYTAAEVAGIDAEDLHRHFEAQSEGTTFAVGEDLRQLVRFRELNLHGEWPMRRQFDAIFCRNVVIYFDGDRQSRLWPRFHAALHADGNLFLGHSERIHPLEGSGFISSGVTIFRKI